MIESTAISVPEHISVAAETQPEILILHDLLLSIGGRKLVPPMTIDSDMPELVRNGSQMLGQVQYRRMQRSGCHRNVAKLWLRVPRRLFAIGTGYALSDDGLWRQHSWGVK